MMLRQSVSRPTRRFIWKVPLRWIGLEICDTLPLIARGLGFLTLIGSGVTVLRIILRAWGAETFIRFLFIGNVI